MKNNPLKKSNILPVYLFSHQSTWFYLFHMLLAFIVLYPYLETPGEVKTPFFIGVMNTAIIITIVYTVSYSKKQFYFALTLGGLAGFFYWLPDSQAIFITSRICIIALYLYTIAITLQHILLEKEVGKTESIYSVISLYILLGMTWAIAYQLIDLIYPGSFYSAGVQNIDQIFNWSDFLFFSFTTLTTLGYGDITPITSQARSLAILEAITGVIFLTVMIARLINIHTDIKKT